MSSANYYTPTQDKYRVAKWGFENDQEQSNTYQKNLSINKSTQYGSKSQYRSKCISKLESAKKSIDEVILDISEKKDLNNEALREVRSVNSEIIQDFRRQAAPYQHRDHIAKSAVSYFPPKSPSASTHYVSSHQDQSSGLRSRLNQELRKNNELMARLDKLEQQNEYLRQNNQMSFRSSPRDSELKAQNQKLKQLLSQMAQLPQEIFGQLEQLKRQNQYLRSDTVKLLKKVERF